MQLSFLRPHKSILSLTNLELPNFVVLTGINGAGKSHLLEAIENGAVQIDSIVINNQTKPIRRFDWSNLVPQDTGAFAPSQINQERYGLWSEITQRITEHRPQLIEILRQFGRLDLANLSIKQIRKITPESLMASGTFPEQANQITQAIANAISNMSQNVAHSFAQNDRVNRPILLSLLQNSSNLPLIALEESDFYNFFPQTWQPVDMFQQSFSRLFADYQRNWLENQLRTLANSKGEPVSFLTDEEFLVKYGIPPWEFVNNILETANLDFRINEPAKYEDRPYEPVLTDQIRGAKVKFSDLSSGERILMSFALCLYYAGDARQIIDYPQILLFDEIDAPLHPSMTQSLLRTIQDILVNKLGIKVILTTHSPSTVALSNEESIYVMSKIEQNRIKKSSKDAALKLLTSGVPSFSVNYENRRQVFVESPYDVYFYEKIYRKILDHLDPEISLSFIASGETKTDKNGQPVSNCGQVINVTKVLREAGNKFIWGIVDWDAKNNETDFMKVLGDGNRYSIESYLLDPILVAALLLREKMIQRRDLGLPENVTHIDFKFYDNAQLQKIADYIIRNVETFIKPQNHDVKTVNLLNGKAINIPIWYLHHQGHHLEEKLLQAFPKLNAIKVGKEEALKNAIIDKVIDDIPELISIDFQHIFKKLQAI